MKSVSTVLAGLFRALAGNSKAEDTDSVLLFKPVGNLVYSPPLPLQIPQTVGIDTRQSLLVWDQQAFTLDVNFFKSVKLLEGVWEIEFLHYIGLSSAVDVTASATVHLAQDRPGGVFRSPISFLRPVASSSIFQFTHRKFQIAVDAKNPVTFEHSIENGAGTATAQSIVSMICNRLL